MRLAIVSGGSKGLGHELCRQYLERGYRVIEFSRSAPHAYSVRTDFSSPEASRAAVAAALAPLAGEPWEEIVAIANAAMITPIGPTSRQATDALVVMLHASFVAPILFATEVIAKFQSTPARKVLANITSGGATRGQAGLSLYCGAKAGLENFVRAVALEQAGEAQPFVVVNIDPGAMDTEMQTSIVSSSPADFPDVARFVQRKAEGTLRVPAKVAAAAMRIVALPDLAGGSRHNVGDYGGA